MYLLYPLPCGGKGEGDTEGTSTEVARKCGRNAEVAQILQKRPFLAYPADYHLYIYAFHVPARRKSQLYESPFSFIIKN